MHEAGTQGWQGGSEWASMLSACPLTSATSTLTCCRWLHRHSESEAGGVEWPAAAAAAVVGDRPSSVVEEGDSWAGWHGTPNDAKKKKLEPTPT